MKGRTVVAPEGMPSGALRQMLIGVGEVTLMHALPPCMSIRLEPAGIVLRDPHQHLDDPEARALWAAEIKRSADPVLARLVIAVFIGPTV